MLELSALIVHLVTLALLLTTIVYTDHLALLWILGKKKVLEEIKLIFLHRIIQIGLVCMIVSGSIIFHFHKEQLLTTPIFYLKMLCITALVLNGIAIGRLMHIATTKSFAELTTTERKPLFIHGAISTAAWILTITSAFMLGL